MPRQSPDGHRLALLLCLLILAVAPATAAPRRARPLPRATAATIDAELASAIRSAPVASRWPNNDYARILDTADLTVRPDGTTIGVYRETYKLFNERARRLAEVNLPYNSTYQSVDVISARTIRPDGTIVEVKPADIRQSAPYSDYAMYDDSRSVGFSMPAVEDDCVIDYRYRIVTRPLLMPGQFWQYWAFTGPEPVGISRFVLHAPARLSFTWRAFHADDLKPAVQVSADGLSKTYTWQVTNADPLASEPAMPDTTDVGKWMLVTSMPDWQHVAKWYWGLARPQMATTPALTRTVAALTAGAATDAARARAIYDWVANRVRYVGLEFGLSAFRPHGADEVYRNLYGDCKDKATLLIAMLGAAGIKAYPVLLHADSQEKVEARLPSLNAFNHCIAVAHVDGQDVWLDATAETCGYGDVPEADRGAQGFVIREGKGEFVTIPQYAPEQTGFETVSRIALKADGSAGIETETRMRGADAQQWRAYVRSMTPEQRDDMLQNWAQTVSAATTLNGCTLPDGTDKIGPFVVKLNLTAPLLAKRTKHFLVVPADAASHDDDTRNPFTKPTRTWPIVIEHPTTQTSTAIITAPEGYRIEEVPADVTAEGPLFRYARTVAVSADGRTLTITLTSTTRAGSVSPADYAAVRAYYNTVLKASEDIAVLKKVEPD